MVREEEVLAWFGQSESYKRIEVLCGLLNMCLPFELRFVGAYVEELGKRDFQELRGAELRANNADDLRSSVSMQDLRAPRRMALYVSLLRSTNAACARTLHSLLLDLERQLGQLDFSARHADELLLLYTMALHHPAFTFEQRAHYGDVLRRLKRPPVRERHEAALPPPESYAYPSSPCNSRPSTPVTPPHHERHHLTAAFNQFTIGRLRNMEDNRLYDMGFPADAVSQLRSIEKLNGVRRPQHMEDPPPPPPPVYRHPRSHHHHHRSSGSDSGSSTGSRSPSDTPAPQGGPTQLGPGRPHQPSSPLYLQQQPQQTQPQTPYVQPHYQRSVYPAAFAPYAPGFAPFPSNGEAPPIYGAPYNPSYVPVQIFAQPKLSCWNCGAFGHSGEECKEPSIEEVTRAGGYQLDYSTPPDPNEK